MKASSKLSNQGAGAIWLRRLPAGQLKAGDKIQQRFIVRHTSTDFDQPGICGLKRQVSLDQASAVWVPE